MNLVSLRIITSNVSRLVAFYERITGVTPRWYTEEYAELSTRSGTLAIASHASMQRFGAGAARPGANQTAILEFQVDDVDLEYARIQPLVGEFALEPTDQPWGNRSTLFRDPDGNLVNFFTPRGQTAAESR